MRQLSLFGGKRQRGVTPPSATEDNLHFTIAALLRRYSSPGWLPQHIPLGEKRDPITGARLKAMGTMPGWFDFQLLSPHRLTYFLELKRQGHKLNANQKVFADYLDRYGYPFAVTDNYDDTIAVLKHWRAVRVSL